MRGTTSKKIVQMMREAGAEEVHIRVVAPADHASRLLRHRYAQDHRAAGRQHDASKRCAASWAPTRWPSSPSTASIAPWADQRDARNPQFTDHCFTGDYPTTLTDQHGPARSGQLSFLSECAKQAGLSLRVYCARARLLFRSAELFVRWTHARKPPRGPLLGETDPGPSLLRGFSLSD